jgi:hypothetical protein
MTIASGETNVVTLQTQRLSRAQNEADMKQRLGQLSSSLQLIFDLSQTHFKGSIQTLFDHIDDSLFELADRAESNLEQNIFFESMREIRIHRRDMEKIFLCNIAIHFVNVLTSRSGDVSSDFQDRDSLDIDDLSLVGHEDLEELVAIDSLVKKSWLKNKSAIVVLTARINSVVPLNLSERNNPLTPRSLADSFVDAASVLSIDIKAKLVLFKLFDRHVIQELPSVFKFVDQALTDQGIAAAVLPRRLQAAHAESYQNKPHRGRPSKVKSPAYNNQPIYKGVALKDKLSSAPSAQALYATLQSLLQTDSFQSQTQVDLSDVSHADNLPNNYALTEVSLVLIDALSQIQQRQAQQNPLADAVSSSEAQPILLSSSNIKMVIQSTGEKLLVDERSQDVMMLVDMLFSFILEDENLPDPIKLLLARLQIPFIKVALADENFFKKDGHPAKRLLNEMAIASIGWTGAAGAEKRDPLLIKIEATVSRILKDFDVNFELFSLLLTDFKAFIEKERRRVLLFEKRAIDAEVGKAQSEVGRKEVDKKLASLVLDKTIPKIFKEFIAQPWGNILFLIYMRQGPNSKQWQNALNVASELVWSALPIEDDNHKIKLNRLLPRLDNVIKKSLENMAFNPARQTQFLTVFHEHYLLLFKNYRQKSSIDSSSAAPVDAVIDSLSGDNNVVATNNKRTESNVETNAEARSSNQLPRLNEADIADMIDEYALIDVRSSVNRSSNTSPVAGVVSASRIKLIGESPSADTQYINLVDNFTVGVWFEKHDDDVISFRCRLAAIIRGTSKYIFVNRAGIKVAEETRETLAILLQQGKLRTLDDGMLFDRALESLITKLRTPK